MNNIIRGNYMIINKQEMPKMLFERKIIKAIFVITTIVLFLFSGYLAVSFYLKRSFSDIFSSNYLVLVTVAIVLILFNLVALLQVPMVKRKEKAAYLQLHYVYDVTSMNDSTEKEFVDHSIGKYAFYENGFYLEAYNKTFQYNDLEIFATYEELLRFIEKKNGNGGKMIRTPALFIQIFAKKTNEDDEFIIKIPLIKEIYYWIERYNIRVRGLDDNLSNIRTYISNYMKSDNNESNNGTNVE